MSRIYVVGTCDTKGEELAYVAATIASLGARPVIVDVGTRSPTGPADVSAREVAACGELDPDTLLSLDDRGAAVTAMGEAFARFVTAREDICAMIGIGGGGGTSIVTTGMRVLPIGVPKLMVSTLASGDVSAFVDVTDITMMPSVTDLAGLNRLSRAILHNAACAIAGMCATPAPVVEEKPALGLTMFGVTTAAVTAIAEQLGATHDCLIFHATGTGGRAMEKLVASDMLVGVLDITTTEVCDLLCGGVLSAGEGRLDAVAARGLPYVGSVGALDMVNFWAIDTVPERYRDRRLHRHNPNVTLMRTNREECRHIGEWIGAKLQRMDGPVRFMIPEKGVSALDIDGGDFHDPQANAALFEAIEASVDWNERRRLLRLPCHINDPAFADAAVSAYREIATHP